MEVICSILGAREQGSGRLNLQACANRRYTAPSPDHLRIKSQLYLGETCREGRSKMKSIKLFGLAALAALAAMAFVSASSASAITTQLCKVDENLCASGNEVKHEHSTTLPGHPAVWLSSAGNVLCYALFLGDTLLLAQPQVIHGHFTFGLTGDPCVRHKLFGGTENCTVTEVSTDSLISVSRTTHESAEVTYSNEVNVHCGSFINCTYNGEGLKATATGPLLSSFENGDVTLTNQTIHSTGGAFCPETAKWHFELMSLEKVYYTE